MEGSRLTRAATSKSQTSCEQAVLSKQGCAGHTPRRMAAVLTVPNHARSRERNGFFPQGGPGAKANARNRNRVPTILRDG